MRISHQHRFVFLAVPRTASTTLRRILDDYSDVKSVHISRSRDDHPFYHHITARELIEIFQSKDWRWADYTKFCCVRNPYDRLVSLYHHHIVQKTRRFGKAGRIVHIFAQTIVSRFDTFSKYVIRIQPHERLPASLQSFACDKDGHCVIDDFMVFEKLECQLPVYLDQWGIHVSAAAIPHMNASLNRRAYRRYYSDHVRKIAEGLYRYEIERFNYQF